MSKEKKANNSRAKTMHSIIGVLIMLGFGYLPISLTGITPIGMKLLGIFIGTLYLWSTVDALWPSLLSVCLIGFSSYAPMNKVLGQLLGNATAVQLIFMMLFTGALVYYGITKYIVHYFLTLKFVNGKPWVITSLLMGATYLVATFIGPFASIFLFFTIMYDVYKEVGFTKEDAYVKITLVLVVILSLIGSATLPYRGSILSVVESYHKITNGTHTINTGVYFIFAFILGGVMLALFILVSKYIIRPNVEPLKALDIETLNKEKLPPMDLSKKIILGGFVALLFFMLVPSLMEDIPVMKFLSSNTACMPMLITAILCAIKVDGKPVFELQKVASKQFSWSSYFISVVAILFGSILTSEEVGLTVFLKSVLTPVLGDISPFFFVIIVVLLAAFLTNIGNSLVMGMLFLPIIHTFSLEFGMDSLPIVILLIFTVNATAAMTPAASAYSAIMFGNNEWLEAKDIYKYSSIFVLVEVLVVLVIGIPTLYSIV